MKVLGIITYLASKVKNYYTLLKPLPFRGYKKKYKEVHKEGNKWVGNYYVNSSYDKILGILKVVNLAMPHIKQVVIDDKR